MEASIGKRASDLRNKAQLMQTTASKWAARSKEVGVRASQVVNSYKGQLDQQAQGLVDVLLENIKDSIDTSSNISTCVDAVFDTILASTEQMYVAGRAGRIEASFAAETILVSNLSALTTMVTSVAECGKTATKALQSLLSFYEEQQRGQKADNEAARTSLLTVTSVFTSIASQSLVIKGWLSPNSYDVWSYILSLTVVAGTIVSQSVAMIAERKKTFDLVKLVQLVVAWITMAGITISTTSDINGFAKTGVLLISFITMFFAFTSGMLFKPVDFVRLKLGYPAPPHEE